MYLPIHFAHYSINCEFKITNLKMSILSTLIEIFTVFGSRSSGWRHLHSSVLFHSTSEWIAVMLAQCRTALTQPLALATCLVVLVNVPDCLTEQFLASPKDSCQTSLPY